MKIANPFERFGVSQADYDGTENYGRFVIEPLERGFGLTLGNALRRVLLSSLPGASIYAIEIEGARHEFSAIEGVEEDVTSIILNLKDLILAIDVEDDSNKKLEINVEGPKPSPLATSSAQLVLRLLIQNLKSPMLLKVAN